MTHSRSSAVKNILYWFDFIALLNPPSSLLSLLVSHLLATGQKITQQFSSKDLARIK